MRHAAVLLASVLLASIAALGISAVESPSAEAAGGGYVKKKCGGGKIFLNAKEKETFARHNNIRRNHNLPTFCVHPDLQRAARFHSEEMLREDYFDFDHRSCDSDRSPMYYETFSKRIERFGYNNYRTIGENMAYGADSYGTPASRMNAWMNSPGHKANILNGDYREIGIGVREGNFQGPSACGGDFKYYSGPGTFMYTADFGTRFR